MSRFFCLFILCLFTGSFRTNASVDSLAASEAELRYSIHPDDWIFSREFFVKGKYFGMGWDSFQEIELTKKHNQKFIVFFSDSNLKNIAFSLGQDGYIYRDGRMICSTLNPVQAAPPRRFYHCGHGQCFAASDGDLFSPRTPFVNREFFGVEKSSCPVDLKLEWISKFSSNFGGATVLFRDYRVFSEKRILEVKQDKLSFYLNIEKCFKVGGAPSCKEISVETSMYEKSLLNLRKVQSEKSHARLNSAIEKLGFCVRKKDVRCAERYILRSKDGDPNFNETKITDDVFLELSHCLNYDNLLPHLAASRGVKRVCIFNDGGSDKPLKNIAFVEALSNAEIDVAVD